MGAAFFDILDDELLNQSRGVDADGNVIDADGNIVDNPFASTTG